MRVDVFDIINTHASLVSKDEICKLMEDIWSEMDYFEVDSFLPILFKRLFSMKRFDPIAMEISSNSCNISIRIDDCPGCMVDFDYTLSRYSDGFIIQLTSVDDIAFFNSKGFPLIYRLKIGDMIKKNRTEEFTKLEYLQLVGKVSPEDYNTIGDMFKSIPSTAMINPYKIFNILTNHYSSYARSETTVYLGNADIGKYLLDIIIKDHDLILKYRISQSYEDNSCYVKLISTEYENLNFPIIYDFGIKL